MRISIVPVLILGATAVYAAVVHVPVNSNLELGPGEAHTVTLEAAEPIEIGWQAVQAKSCSTNCVQATDLTGRNSSIATPLGASIKYIPNSGRVSIEYKNVSAQPVTINVFRVQRTCEAESCKFIDEKQKGRWLVYKIDEFKSLVTSQDGSYSVVSGIAVGGRPFRLTAVWWSDDNNALRPRCAGFLKRYLDNHTPKEQYQPYVLSGQAVGEGNDIVLTSIDTCVPKAPHFGVPEKNVFK